MTSLPTQSVELLIVGAGPVGLFGALSAARRGIDVMVLDQSFRGHGRGYATLLHPRSLRLLAEAGVADELIAIGRRIDHVRIYVENQAVATLDLADPALAIPQSALEETLLSALRAKGVVPQAPYQATTIEQDADGARVRVVRRELGSPERPDDWSSVESSQVRARFVVGADGYDSRVRAALGIEAATVGSTESFAIFEFPASTEQDDLALCFSDGLGSAMIPLPNGRARWAFQIAADLDQLPGIERFNALLGDRASWYRDGTRTIDWGTVIQFERRLVRSFGRGRVWLAGDAAHVTSPFGGQSMNGGLFEVHELVSRVCDCAAGKRRLDTFEHYARQCGREWHKLLGVDVSFELLPHAPSWLASYARRMVPALPASGHDLEEPLERLGLRMR